MHEFRPNQPANEAHDALKSALQTMAKAKQCAVLWFGEILDRKLYRDLGYSSINQYAEVELGFSTSRTRLLKLRTISCVPSFEHPSTTRISEVPPWGT